MTNSLNNSKPEKIIVHTADELTDILRKIDKEKSGKIILTFAEESDLLISPINLKVIQEHADESGKSVIAQIIHNPTGTRNAQNASIITYDSAGEIPPNMWHTSEMEMKKRVREKADLLKSTHLTENESAFVGEVPENVAATAEEEIQDISPEMSEKLQTEGEEMIAEAAVPDSDFKQRINNALAKSRQDILDQKHKLVHEGDFVLAMDEDIADIKLPAEEKVIPSRHLDSELTTAEKVVHKNEQHKPVHKPKEVPKTEPQQDEEQPPSLIGRDFVTFKAIESGEPDSVPTIQDHSEDSKAKPAVSNKGGFFSNIAIKSPSSIINPKDKKNGAKFAKLTNNSFVNYIKGNKSKVAVRLLIPVLLVSAVFTYFAYIFLPLVKVELFIESKAVAVEEVFTGNMLVTELSLTSNEIPTKAEEIEKERSDNTTATGKAFRGKRASGVVTIKFFKDETVTVPAGTIVTTSGKSYATVSAVTIEGPGKVSATIEATQVGEEYNLSSGNIFSVAGYPSSDMTAENPASITGGSKEEYTVVSQEDVDKIVNKLKESTFQEATNELKNKQRDGWAIIENTLKNELVGDTKTDVPVGAEAELVNVTIKTKSRALFYKRSELEKKQNELIESEAEEKDLFKSESDISLVLEDIKSDITVQEVNGDDVKIKFSATGNVKPEVNKEEITNDLKGKGWEEGMKYLEDLGFTTKDPKVEFQPGSFPGFMKYFPSRQGRIVLKVSEV